MDGQREFLLYQDKYKDYKHELFLKCKDEATKEKVLNNVNVVGLWTSYSNISYRGFCKLTKADTQKYLEEKGYTINDVEVLNANISLPRI